MFPSRNNLSPTYNHHRWIDLSSSPKITQYIAHTAPTHDPVHTQHVISKPPQLYYTLLCISIIITSTGLEWFPLSISWVAWCYAKYCSFGMNLKRDPGLHVNITVLLLWKQVHAQLTSASAVFSLHSPSQPYHKPSRSTRSSASHLLSVPRHNLSFGARAFRVAVPKIWNSIYLFTSANLEHTLPSDVILRRTTCFQPISPPSGPCNAPWFSSETLALYKSLTYLCLWLSFKYHNCTCVYVCRSRAFGVVFRLRRHCWMWIDDTVSAWRRHSRRVG